MPNFPKSKHLFVFWEICRALFSWTTCFEIRSFDLSATICHFHISTQLLEKSIKLPLYIIVWTNIFCLLDSFSAKVIFSPNNLIKMRLVESLQTFKKIWIISAFKLVWRGHNRWARDVAREQHQILHFPNYYKSSTNKSIIKSNTPQQTFQRRLNVVFRLIWRRDVAQRQINVETMLCTSTLKFTTFNNIETTL